MPQKNFGSIPCPIDLILLMLIVLTTAHLIGFPSIARSMVTIEIGEGSGIPGSSDNPVEVSLTNLNDKVKGISVDICDMNNYLTCTGCKTTDRSTGFNCIPSELDNG